MYNFFKYICAVIIPICIATVIRMSSLVARNRTKTNKIKDSERNQNLIVCGSAGDDNVHDKVDYFCNDCQEHLCLMCFESHKRTKLTKNHTVDKIATCANNRNEDDDDDHSLHELKCLNHKGQKLEEYCKDCDAACCIKCAQTTHSNHAFTNLEDKDKETTATITKSLSRINLMNKDLQSKLENTKSSLNTLESSYKHLVSDAEAFVVKVKEELRATFDAMMTELDESWKHTVDYSGKEIDSSLQQLQEDISNGESQISQLSCQIESHKRYLSPSTSAVARIEYVKQSIHNASVNELPLQQSVSHPAAFPVSQTVSMPTHLPATFESNFGQNSASAFPGYGPIPPMLGYNQRPPIYGYPPRPMFSPFSTRQMTPQAQTPYFSGQYSRELLTNVRQPVVVAAVKSSLQPTLNGSNSLSTVTKTITSWKSKISDWKDRTEEILNQSVSILQTNTNVESKEDSILVSHLERSKYGIAILSLFSDDLLVSSWQADNLFVYHVNGYHVNTVRVHNKLCDAVYTTKGDIVYTSTDHRLVILSNQASAPIVRDDFTYPQYLSTSSDGTIYLADWKDGAYESTDGGFHWNHLFNIDDGYRCWQLIKVQTEQGNAFWSLELKGEIKRLRYCFLNRTGIKLDRRNLEWRDVDLRISHSKFIDLQNSRMAFDDDKRVFINDFNNNAVHVFLTNGQYERQLLSEKHGIKKPCRLAYDRRYQRLYVGQQRGEIKLYHIDCQDVSNDRL